MKGPRRNWRRGRSGSQQSGPQRVNQRAQEPGRQRPLFRFSQLTAVERRSGASRGVKTRIPVRVCTRDTLTESAAMTTAPRSLRVTKRTSIGLYCARLRVPRRGGARPSVGPLPGLPVFQRPLQEDLSRSAENQPVCIAVRVHARSGLLSFEQTSSRGPRFILLHTNEGRNTNPSPFCCALSHIVTTPS